MTVYLLNIFLILLEGIIFLPIRRRKFNGRKMFCTLAGAQWILISGLRGIHVGADTYAYYRNFRLTIKTPWSEILGDFVKKYLYGEDLKDPGYGLLKKIFQIFSTDYQVFLMAIAIFFGVLMGRWIYRYSSDPCISYIIYSTLFFEFYAITGHRQTIATAMVVFIGYELIRKRAFWRFLILTLVASTIHATAILFLPMYFIYNIKLTRDKLLIYAGVTAAVPLLLRLFLVPVTRFFGYDHYLEKLVSGGTYTYTALLALILIAGLVQRKAILAQNPSGEHALNATVWAVILSVATFQVQGFMRIQQYYALFIMILVPDIINTVNKKQGYLIKVLVICLLVLLFARKGNTYNFFWQ